MKGHLKRPTSAGNSKGVTTTMNDLKGLVAGGVKFSLFSFSAELCFAHNTVGERWANYEEPAAAAHTDIRTYIYTHKRICWNSSEERKRVNDFIVAVCVSVGQKERRKFTIFKAWTAASFAFIVLLISNGWAGGPSPPLSLSPILIILCYLAGKQKRKH